jgi:hypothetical protein
LPPAVAVVQLGLDATRVRYVPPEPFSLADVASLLGIRLVEFAQAIREGNVATVRGRGGEVLIAQDVLGRVRREGVGV